MLTRKEQKNRLIGYIAAVFLVAISLRGWSLNSDPPAQLSWSLAPFTDGPAAISAAREAFLEEQGFIVRLTHPNSNPFVAGVIRIVMRITGSGLWQGRLLFVIAGCLSCVAMLLILYRDQHSLTALCGGMLLATNYVFVQYNRLALEESLVNLLGLASFACLQTLKTRHTFLSGLLAGVMVFLIKLHGLVYVAAMALALFGCWISIAQMKPRLVKVAGSWLAGFALLFLAGNLLQLEPAYAPLGQYFVDPLSEESTLSPAVSYLVGTPSRTLSIGHKTGLFLRMPATCLLAFFLLLSLIARAERGHKNIEDAEQTFIPSELILACMVTATFAGLSLLEYRPLRYETLLIPSLAGMAALLLGRWLTPVQRSKQPDPELRKAVQQSGLISIICLRGLRAMVLFYLIHLVLWELRDLIFVGRPLDTSSINPARITLTLLLWLPVLQFWQSVYKAVSGALEKPRVALAAALVSLLALVCIQGWQTVRYFRDASGNTISSSRNVAPLFPAVFMITGELADAICVETEYASRPYSSPNPSIHEALEQSPKTGALLVSALEHEGRWEFHFGGVSEEIRKGNWMPILAQSLGPVSVETRIVQVLIARTGAGHFRLGMACLLSGDERSALHHFQTFLKSNPDHMPALLYAAALDSKWEEITPSETEAFRKAEQITKSGVPVNDWDRHHFEALRDGKLELLWLTEPVASGGL